MQRLILFGAGASYGSESAIPKCPPLGAELFQELRMAYPGTWGKLPPVFNRKFNSNFEEGMSLLTNLRPYSENVVYYMKELGKYFAQYDIDDDSNLYYKFLNELDSPEKYVYSSLNYELLFEAAVKRANLNLSYEETKFNELLLLKLHGSISFLHSRGATFENIKLVGAAPMIDFPIEIATREKVIEFCNSHLTLYPVMCFYMKNKPTQLAPTLIKRIQSKWQQEVMRAERILIIGVKPNIGDEHIWRFLSQTNAKIGYIGSELEFANWTMRFRKYHSDSYLGNTWKGGFDRATDFISN